VPADGDAPAADVRRVLASISFPKGWRSTFFMPDEERMLLETHAGSSATVR
jgi:hypothetical protein